MTNYSYNQDTQARSSTSSINSINSKMFYVHNVQLAGDSILLNIIKEMKVILDDIYESGKIAKSSILDKDSNKIDVSRDDYITPSGKLLKVITDYGIEHTVAYQFIRNFYRSEVESTTVPNQFDEEVYLRTVKMNFCNTFDIRNINFISRLYMIYGSSVDYSSTQVSMTVFNNKKKQVEVKRRNENTRIRSEIAINEDGVLLIPNIFNNNSDFIKVELEPNHRFTEEFLTEFARKKITLSTIFNFNELNNTVTLGFSTVDLKNIKIFEEKPLTEYNKFGIISSVDAKKILVSASKISSKRAFAEVGEEDDLSLQIMRAKQVYHGIRGTNPV